MKVGVLGVATSKFGELWGVSPRRLVLEAAQEALKDSNLKISDIEAVYVGNMLSGILGNQENLGSFVAEELRMLSNTAVFKIEGACASGGLAVHSAFLSILSGIYKKVLVVGVEKMTDHKPEEVATGLMSAGTEEERISGLTFPGLYALLAKAHIERYKTTQEQLAAVAVKNHYHGSLNKKAHFRKRITIENVLESSIIADPLKLFDCSPISDGASCVVLTTEDIAKKKHKKPVWMAASAVATDSLGLSTRKDLTSLSATVKAGEKAYRTANVKPKDIDIAEVHDCFTIAEILALEDLGFFEKGEAGQAVLNGDLTLGTAKKLVVNTSGGLKACGHPVGATGVKQIVEIVDQSRGICEERQVNGAKIGLTHNVGGSGGVAVVHILKI